jgi:hypothetical protein
MGSAISTTVTCAECDRAFDLLDEDDAGEWCYGHDCEPPAPPSLPLDRPPHLSTTGGLSCLDCGLRLILFDDDEHFCEATGTSTELHTDYDPDEPED